MVRFNKTLQYSLVKYTNFWMTKIMKNGATLILLFEGELLVILYPTKRVVLLIDNSFYFKSPLSSRFGLVWKLNNDHFTANLLL
jgi:hypothetical protein